MKIIWFATMFILLCADPSFAEKVVVVVSANSPVKALDKSTVVDIFMGRYVAFPDGSTALPLELAGGATLRQDFYQQLVGMSIPKINAYWSRLKFSGRQSPTIERMSESEVVEFVALNISAIGYVYESKLTPDLKVVLTLNE